MKSLLFTASASLLLLSACGQEPSSNEPAQTVEVPLSTPTPTPTLDPIPSPSPSPVALACGDVSMNGYCGLDYGSSLDDVMANFPGGLDGHDDNANPSETCIYLTSEQPTGTVYLMFVDGVFNRVDIDDEGISTEAGVTVGMNIEAVTRIYPNLEQRPNKYVENQPNLVVEQGETTMVFETDENGQVRSYHVGIEPGVNYVEGCL